MRTFRQFQEDLDAIRRPYESELVRAIPPSCMGCAAELWLKSDNRSDLENMQSMRWDLSFLLNILETREAQHYSIEVKNINALGFEDYDTFVSAIAEWQKAWEEAISVTQKCVTMNGGDTKFAILMFEKK